MGGLGAALGPSPWGRGLPGASYTERQKWSPKLKPSPEAEGQGTVVVPGRSALNSKGWMVCVPVCGCVCGCVCVCVGYGSVGVRVC